MSARRSVLPNFPDLVDKLDNRWLQSRRIMRKGSEMARATLH